MLKGKTIVVGVCGGIAAYKAVEVVSRLHKLNAEVHVIMTKNATNFVAPLTFQSLSHNPVTVDMFDEPKFWDIQHISLAAKADMFLVAPATANVIGKVANGIADDMLTSTLMAAKSPVIFIPAMNTGMYENSIVQENIQKLKKHGYIFIEPDTGLMACGTSGRGRFPVPEKIVEQVVFMLYPKKDFQGHRVLITAGPTREEIDPVRYITNHSSGKMGYALARAAYLRGAEVRLVSGPVNLDAPGDMEISNVVTAREMYEKVMELYTDCDIIAHIAAVADYRCSNVSDHKIKKTGDAMTIDLIKNPDIAREIGKVKGDRIHIGACAETRDLIENAKEKLEAKNFDMIVANDVTMEGAGFNVDTNIVKLIKRDGSIREIPLSAKAEVAHIILDEIADLLQKKRE